MKVKDVIASVERSFGRQQHKYVMALINDGLIEMMSLNEGSRTMNLESGKRFYNLNDEESDITRVAIADEDSDYVQIPLLTNPDNLVKGSE
jgi:hypothetical protein